MTWIKEFNLNTWGLERGNNDSEEGGGKRKKGVEIQNSRNSCPESIARRKIQKNPKVMSRIHDLVHCLAWNPKNPQNPRVVCCRPKIQKYFLLMTFTSILSINSILSALSCHTLRAHTLFLLLSPHYATPYRHIHHFMLSSTTFLCRAPKSES